MNDSKAIDFLHRLHPRHFLYIINGHSVLSIRIIRQDQIDQAYSHIYLHQGLCDSLRSLRIYINFEK